MSETAKILLGLFGGLAIFIYGMNLMSECLQKAAGEKMKSILAMLTKNPLLGVIAGALTTAVLQSSSATTVMASGFITSPMVSIPKNNKPKAKIVCPIFFAFSDFAIKVGT